MIIQRMLWVGSCQINAHSSKFMNGYQDQTTVLLKQIPSSKPSQPCCCGIRGIRGSKIDTPEDPVSKTTRNATSYAQYSSSEVWEGMQGRRRVEKGKRKKATAGFNMVTSPTTARTCYIGMWSWLLLATFSNKTKHEVRKGVGAQLDWIMEGKQKKPRGRIIR